MDFMKVFDQTVREIKREVNLKVLKVPEIEQKVLDATDDEPWGPHGTVLAEIAQATKKYSECQMVMGVLWTRLTETGRNWRYVYKALAVIEYLVANGSERAVDDIIEHTFQISSLSSFEYVELSGKDMGINVRKKVENIVAVLNDKDKIQEARNKAAATRDKYFGLSSTGITYKSGSASLGSSSSRSSDRYGGFGNTRDGDTSSDTYKGTDRYGEDKFDKGTVKSHRGTSDNQENTSKKGSSHYGSTDQGTSAAVASKPMAKISDPQKHASIPSQSSSLPSNNYEDNFDDFDPRGTSDTKSTAGSSHEVNLFGQSLLGDLLDAPASVPSENSTGNSTSSEVDLFADAAFVSAPSSVEAGGSSETQAKVNLFATRPASSSAASSTIDFFAAPGPVTTKAVDPFAFPPENKSSNSEPVTTKAIDPFAFPPENKSSNSEPVTSKAIDPFAAVPLNNFDGSDLFGSFTSNNDSSPKEPSQIPINEGSNNNLNEKSQTDSKTSSKKDTFQVKSGIWADSLSRGLIDLNISAPKKVNLADVGIVGGLTETDESAKAPPTSFYMGRAMGTGTGLGKSGFNSTATGGDDIFSNFTGQQQYQFNNFKK